VSVRLSRPHSRGFAKAIGEGTAAAVHRWRPTTVWAYVVPTVVAAVSVQFWFRGDSALAGGDVIPPIAPRGDYIAHWNQLTTGAGSPGYSIISLPYYGGLWLFDALTLGEVAFQRLWLSALVAGATAAVVFLTHQLLRSGLAAAVAGFVATFNAYHLSIGFDPIPLAATIAAGVLGGLVIRAARDDDGPHPLVFALASLSLSFVFANPPHVVLVLAWIAISAVIASIAFDGGAQRVRRFLLPAAPLAILFNLWWIVPAALTVTSSVFHEQYAAPGVAAWAWTHARNTISNILALTSFWSWPDPEYYPYSARLERMPFQALQYAAAAAAAVGLVLARGQRRRVAYCLGVVGLVAIWLLKGVHPPLARSSLWLYDHLPGYWLFRDASKVRLILVLVFALLAGIAIVELERRSRDTAVAAAGFLVAAALVYSYPLLTGGVVPGKRPVLPPAHVTVPSSWRQAAAYLNSQRDPGKVVVLPRLDYYQVPTTWGYYGASFLPQLIHRPIIEPAPGGYYANEPVTALVDALQYAIVNRTGNVNGPMQALGARYLVLRGDLDITFPGRSFMTPARLARALPRIPQLLRVRSFGPLDIYEAPAVAEPEVYAGSPVYWRRSDAWLFRTLSLGRRTAVVPREVESSLRGIEAGHVQLIRPQRPGLVSVAERPQATIVRVRARPTRAARPAAVTTSYSLPKVSPPLQVLLGSERVIVRRSGEASSRSPGAGRSFVYRFAPGAPRVSIPIAGRLERQVGDCNRYDARSPAEVGLRANVMQRNGVRIIQLAARDHAACVTVPLALRPRAPLLLRLDYRSVAGSPARICVWEEKPGRCATLPPVDSAPGWHRLESVIRATPETWSLRLFLYADGGGGTTTKTEYRAITVQPPQPLESLAVVPLGRLPRVTYRRTSPSEFKVHVTKARKPFLLVVSETYAPGWRIHPDGRSGNGVEHLRVNGYANGWRVPWTGTYDITITYGPERLAQLARRFDLIFIPLSLLCWLGWRSADPRRVRRRRTIRRRRPPVVVADIQPNVGSGSGERPLR